MPPATLVDVGCGAGGWVREFVKAGIDAVGYDGPWAERHLVIPRDRFIPHDLERPLPIDSRYEMAVSIEVAEHLSPIRGPGFVTDLCALSDVVLFSAALPGQVGTHHMDPRWQSYWVRLFADNGYGVIDCVRPALWEVPPGVGYVLAQQCFLFVRGASPHLAMPVNVVHPGLHGQLTHPLRARVVNKLPPRLQRRVVHYWQLVRRRVPVAN